MNSRLISGVLVLGASLAFQTVAHATFHLMQIEQIIGSVDGDTTAQAIQLRMRSSGQRFVSEARLIVVDANGQHPVTLLDFNSDVSNGAQGARVLIASDSFLNKTSPRAVPDFSMVRTIPTSYFAGGSLKFQSDTGTVYWRLSWGSYSGSNSGSTTNDADGNFGPPIPAVLASCGVYAFQFKNGPTALSTNNKDDYRVKTSQSATFVNNDGTSFTASGDLPVVIATATDANASEVPASDVGKVRFERSGCKDETLKVLYALSGTAEDEDYEALSGKANINPTLATSTVSIRPIDDALQEGDETVIVKISPNSAYAIGNPSSATVTIQDNEYPE